jgi:hypothetical protein
VAVGKCRYCGKSLSWRQRSDARYCSNKCRVAAYRALDTDPSKSVVSGLIAIRQASRQSPAPEWTSATCCLPAERKGTGLFRNGQKAREYRRIVDHGRPADNRAVR